MVVGRGGEWKRSRAEASPWLRWLEGAEFELSCRRDDRRADRRRGRRARSRERGNGTVRKRERGKAEITGGDKIIR
jgi:hypothetical protein